VLRAAGETEATQGNIQDWLQLDEGDPGFQLIFISTTYITKFSIWFQFASLIRISETERSRTVRLLQTVRESAAPRWLSLPHTTAATHFLLATPSQQTRNLRYSRIECGNERMVYVPHVIFSIPPLLRLSYMSHSHLKQEWQFQRNRPTLIACIHGADSFLRS
jgi:hypothetical protein